MTVEGGQSVELDLAGAAAAMAAYGAALESRFLERRQEVRGLLIAVLAKANILLLGPPGTAKSDITETFAQGLGWSFFGILMGKTTLPEEVFGPFSLKGLRDDRFERVVDGYLPSVRIGFLDEIYKSSSAILNSLLRIANERKFAVGSRQVSVPLEILIGASNEPPQEDGLEALHDRFLLRYWTGYLKSGDNFKTLLRMERGPAPTLDPAVIDYLRAAMEMVDVEPVVEKVLELRDALAKEHGIEVSDRRWKACMKLIAASAVLDARTVATPRDLAILEHALWNAKEQRDLVRATLNRVRSPELYKMTEFLGVAKGIVAEAPRPESVTLDDATSLSKMVQKLAKVVEEAKGLDRTDPDVNDLFEEIRSIGRQAKALCDKATGRAKL